MDKEKNFTIQKEAYINRYNILINKHTETPGPGDYNKKDAYNR